ncbi:SKP1-like protein 11 [Cornus florida]|uniref:SKP1-like protein 11 n=1 Tax=Cornus florida TaxID=4283 RepID=UPI00289F3A83|nr:SKP1-like protein 11 [Cornus florida]XP_059627185.1 SKP1-like protein 11 [Cornus florida]XP_059627186.1 SKP1-like protein 11 [Cornus florida]
MASTSNQASASTSNKEAKMLTLQSSDNEEFLVEESVAVQSVLIKNIVEEDYTTIPLPNVAGEDLAMIIEYLKKHADPKASEDDLKKFDDKFVDKPQSDLHYLSLAANYLELKDLLDIVCTRIASDIRGYTVEQFRARFNIENDFADQEERVLRNEYPWAFE